MAEKAIDGVLQWRRGLRERRKQVLSEAVTELNASTSKTVLDKFATLHETPHEACLQKYRENLLESPLIQPLFSAVQAEEAQCAQPLYTPLLLSDEHDEPSLSQKRERVSFTLNALARTHREVTRIREALVEQTIREQLDALGPTLQMQLDAAQKDLQDSLQQWQRLATSGRLPEELKALGADPRSIFTALQAEMETKSGTATNSAPSLASKDESTNQCDTPGEAPADAYTVRRGESQEGGKEADVGETTLSDLRRSAAPSECLARRTYRGRELRVVLQQEQPCTATSSITLLHNKKHDIRPIVDPLKFF